MFERAGAIADVFSGENNTISRAVFIHMPRKMYSKPQFSIHIRPSKLIRD